MVVAYLADLAGVQGTASSEELERLRAADGQRCRVCGCTEHYGCYPPCSWVEPDLCSTCVPANV
ncbi:MAG: hypothetical protein KGJ86_17375 [Chloroflexota bacterium]|nr:hypothetical protein [Chloroflexota bacterium]